MMFKELLGLCCRVTERSPDPAVVDSSIGTGVMSLQDSSYFSEDFRSVECSEKGQCSTELNSKHTIKFPTSEDGDLSIGRSRKVSM